MGDHAAMWQEMRQNPRRRHPRAVPALLVMHPDFLKREAMNVSVQHTPREREIMRLTD